MGNQVSNEESTRSSSAKVKDKEATQERAPPVHPVEKLAKALAEKCSAEQNGHGINRSIFMKYVFPKYPRLAELIFLHLVRTSGQDGSKKFLSTSIFKNEAEKLLTVMSDERQIELYLRIFCMANEVNREEFHELIQTAYKLAMDHYPEGGPQSCPSSERTLTAVVNSLFHRKSQLSMTYVTHWIMQHCPGLLLGLHRYIVHCLSTAHRTIREPKNLDEGVDLSTPVLERVVTYPDLAGYARENSSSKSTPEHNNSPGDIAQDAEKGNPSSGGTENDCNNDILPVSQVWILACALPRIYTKPAPLHNEGVMARMLGMICPSHWVLLYNSREQGLGANRFMYHVLNYRGPSLTFLQGEDGVEFCLASTDEWKESNHYWGQDDCMIIQLLPLFHIIEKGPKLLYMNTSIRGYPFGVRAGKDPRKPSVEVNDSFSVMKYCGIPYPLLGIEVWGCGTTHSREAQLDVKKWEVKQAEKQRQVKMTASDWVDHPDRYLLELAGRQSYNK